MKKYAEKAFCERKSPNQGTYITVNGKEIQMKQSISVAAYLENAGYQMKRIAVELNGDILPKYEYSDTMLKDGDRLEVVTFVGGG